MKPAATVAPFSGGVSCVEPVSTSMSMTLPRSRVYSPTETEDWLRCPRYRALRRGRLEARHNPYMPHRDVGKAIHEGLARYYRDIRDSCAGDLTTRAIAVATASIGESYVDNPRYTLEGLQKVITRGVKTVIELGVMCPPHQVLMVEESLGGCVVDLVTRGPLGVMAIDHKVIYDSDVHKAELRVSEYETSHQLYHQAWVVREHLGETPTYVTIQQLVLTPRALVRVEQFEMDDARIDRWVASAQVHWQRMQEEQEENFAPMNFASCFNKYGKCEMFDHCHRGASLEAFYTRRDG